jgi:Spy/CpxP family protein refolding chaperone
MPPPTPFRGGGPPPQSFGGPGGKWWGNPELVKRLEITPDQLRKMDDALQQSRLKLIDLKATLEKEEVMMEGLLRGPQLDDAKILPAVDRIAQARAELEKANARLMLGIRHILTPEQWEKLNREGPPAQRQGPVPNRVGPGPGGPGNPPPGNPREE